MVPVTEMGTAAGGAHLAEVWFGASQISVAWQTLVAALSEQVAVRPGVQAEATTV